MNKPTLREILEWIIHNGILANTKEDMKKVINQALIQIEELMLREEEIETILTYFGIVGRPQIARAIAERQKEKMG